MGAGLDVAIRPFRTGDREAVVALWSACGLVVPWNDPHKDIDRKLKVDRDLFLVGEVESGLVATVMGGYEGHRGWINYLAVAPAHQGRGVGRLMVEHLEGLLEARGCPKINLQVRESNEDVIAYYESLGYRKDRSITLGKRLEHDD